MNPAQLLAYFERLADAPDAIPRLRRFILDLAVRGKLVEQDPKDEPAAELLKRIENEKAGLVKAGKIRKQDSQRYLTNEDVRFEVPAEWAWTRLGAIGDWGSGSTPSRGVHEYFGGGITWLKSGELNDNESLAGSEETVTQLALEKCSFRRNAPGDILFAMYGATIGKVAILAEPAVTNQAVVGCTPFGGVFNRYLFKFLVSQRAQFHLASEGGAQPNVSKEKMVRCPFPLPPLAEQRRIVAKVDELMALCDRLEAAQTERESRRDRLVRASLHGLNQSGDAQALRDHAGFALDHLPRLSTRRDHIPQIRQTILNLAVRGKLMHQDPNDEPAAELLKRIQAERLAEITTGNAKPGKDLRANRDECPAFDAPTSWSWSTLGELAFGIRYGTSIKCSYEPGGEPVLRIPNIRNGRINLEDLKYGPLPAREADDLRLRPGDILMVRSNGSLDLVGRPALVESDAAGFCYAGYLVRVRTSGRHLDPQYLLLVLTTRHVRDQIEIPIRTTVGLKNVNATELSGLTIPLPPLAEQHRIVAKVDELMALCDRLEAQLTTAQTESRRLLEAVLYEALATSA